MYHTNFGILALLSLLLGLGNAGCDTKKKQDQAPSPKQDPGSGTASGGAPGTQKGTARFGIEDLSSPAIREKSKLDPEAFLSRAAKRERGANPKRIPKHLEGPSAKYSHLEAGSDFFCGLLKTGALQCWGSVERTVPGPFNELAVFADEACALSGDGKVQCLDFPAPPWTQVKSLSGSGPHLCGVDQGGKVMCTSLAGPALEPPDDLVAKKIAVGADFACSIDKTNKLVCWGAIQGLQLPSARMTDLASVGGGICVLDSHKKTLCLKAEIDMGETQLSSLSGGNGTLCGKNAKEREVICKGGLERAYRKPARAVVASADALCALQPDGVPDCVGKRYSAQLRVPRAKSEEKKPDQAAFQKFLAQFPEEKLPLHLDQTTKIEVLDQLTNEYQAFVPGHASEYRIIARVPTPSPSVILLRWSEAQLILATYKADGTLVSTRTLASLSKVAEARNIDADGQPKLHRLIKATETQVEAGGHITTTHTYRHEAGAPPPAPAEAPPKALLADNTKCYFGQIRVTDQITVDGRIERNTPGTFGPMTKGDCSSKWPPSEWEGLTQK